MKIYLLTLLCLITSGTYSQVTSFNISDDVLNKPLKDSLEAIYKLDQSVRSVVSEAIKAKKPKEYIDSLRTFMRQSDHANLIKVREIIRQNRWQSPQKVGMIGSQGLFLVIQHADLQTQLQYLPIIKEAEQKVEILSSNVAIFEDRINVR